MSKKSREIEKQKQRISKAEKEKRLNIVNSCCKCTICGAWIKYPSRKRHLRTEHNLFPEDIKSYFLNRKAARAEEREERSSVAAGVLLLIMLLKKTVCSVLHTI